MGRGQGDEILPYCTSAQVIAAAQAPPLRIDRTRARQGALCGRLVINGTDVLCGSYGESSATHRSEATALWLQNMAVLEAGDTVELQGFFRAHDGFFAAEQTSFWGAKLG